MSATTTLLSGATCVRRRLAVVALMICIGLATAGAANAAGRVVSTGFIPLEGSVGSVNLLGGLHVVVQIPPDPIIPAAIFANLPAMDVVATDLSGAEYLAHGAGAASLACYPSDPCTPTISGFLLHRTPFID